MKGAMATGPAQRVRTSGISWRTAVLVTAGITVVVIAAIWIGVALQGPYVGTVQFGRNYRDTGNTFAIVGGTRTFGPGERIAYIAHIGSHVNTHRMLVTFYRQSGKSLTFVSRFIWKVRNVRDTHFADRFTGADMADLGIVRSGTYVMRFYRGKTLLARGTFTRRR